MASYTVRLSWKTDLDLIAMYMHPDFNFSKFLRMAVTAYARGDDSFYIIPPERKCEIGALKNVAVHFRLSEETEADVIDFLSKIREGQGCAAMKIIFRSYMKYPYLDPYFSSLYTVPVHGFYKKGQGESKGIPDRIMEIRNKAAINEDKASPKMQPNEVFYQEKPDIKHSAAETSSKSSLNGEMHSVYTPPESIIPGSNEVYTKKESYENTVPGNPAGHLPDVMQSVKQNDVKITESSPAGAVRQEPSDLDRTMQEQTSPEEENEADDGVNEELFGMFGNMMNM